MEIKRISGLTKANIDTVLEALKAEFPGKEYEVYSVWEHVKPTSKTVKVQLFCIETQDGWAIQDSEGNIYSEPEHSKWPYQATKNDASEEMKRYGDEWNESSMVLTTVEFNYTNVGDDIDGTGCAIVSCINPSNEGSDSDQGYVGSWD